MDPVLVKICGLRDTATAVHAVRCGADAIGMVMAPGSPRHVERELARRIAQAVHEASEAVDVVLVVAAMPAADAAREAAAVGADVLQLHGAYTREDFTAARELLPRLWRATSLVHHPGLRAGEFGEERLLVDGMTAGSGHRWQLDPADAERLGTDWILAGGGAGPAQRGGGDGAAAAGRCGRVQRRRIGPRGEGSQADRAFHRRGEGRWTPCLNETPCLLLSPRS